MESNIADKTKRAPATKVGGMRVPAHDHSVPVVRKEYERKAEENDEENEHQRQLEKSEQFEYEKQTRLDAGERLARMQENHPRNEPNNNLRQRENFHVNQPILHNHNKSGASALN